MEDTKKERKLAILAILGLACFWPLLRRTYPGLAFQDTADPRLAYLFFLLFEAALVILCFVFVRRMCWLTHNRSLITTLVCAFSLLGGCSLASDSFGDMEAAVCVAGGIGLGLECVLLACMWITLLAHMPVHKAIRIACWSFLLSFFVSLISLLADPIRLLLLGTAPALSALAWFAASRNNLGEARTEADTLPSIREMFHAHAGSSSYTRSSSSSISDSGSDSNSSLDSNAANSPNQDATSFLASREIIFLLIFFMIVGALLRGLSVDAGARFAPENVASDIILRNALGMALSLALIAEVEFSFTKHRKLTLIVMPLCVLLLVGVFILGFGPTEMANQGINLVTTVRLCLEFLLFLVILTCVHRDQELAVRSLMLLFLLPSVCTNLISYVAVPLVLEAAHVQWEEYSAIFALGSALLLTLGMLTVFGLMLSRPPAAKPNNPEKLSPDAAFDQVASEYNLTERETVVARELARGCSYKKVAETLFLSLSTIQSHARSIYRKCGVNSRQELIDLVESKR